MSIKHSLLLAMVAVWSAETSAVSAATIDTLRTDQSIRIAYRADAPPFSYKDAKSGEPAGFMIHLCQAVTKKLAEQLGVPSLKIVYVPVTAESRFDAIEKHDADLLCEPTTATLGRRKRVDFSIPTFVDGMSLMTNDASLHSLHALSGHKVGVLSGTTTENVLRRLLKERDLPVEVVTAKTHDDGIAMLENNAISAYFGDHAILGYLLKVTAKAPDKLHMSGDYLTVEPYALALARGDEDFRLQVDTALSHIFRSNEINEIYDRGLGGTKQSDLIEALYVVAGLPD